MRAGLRASLALLALTALLASVTPLTAPPVTAGSGDAAVINSPPWVKGVLVKGPVLDADYDPLTGTLVLGTAEGAFMVSADDPSNVTTLLAGEEVTQVAVNGEAGMYALVTAYGVEVRDLNGRLAWFRGLRPAPSSDVSISSKGFTALTLNYFQNESRVLIYGPNGGLVVNLSVGVPANDVEWSPSGNYLLLRGEDVAVLYSFSGDALNPARSFKDVHAASWSLTKDLLALSNSHGTLKVIDARGGGVRTYYVGLTPQSIAWVPGEARVVLGGRERVAVLNLQDGDVTYSRYVGMHVTHVTWLRGGGVAAALRNRLYRLVTRVDYAFMILDRNLTPVTSVVSVNGTPLGTYPSGGGALLVTTSGVWTLRDLSPTLRTYGPVTGEYASPHSPSVADEYHVAILVRESHANGALYDHVLYVTYPEGVVWERPVAWDVSDVDASRDGSLVAVVGDYLYVFNASNGDLLWSGGAGSYVAWDPKSELLAVVRFGRLTLYDRGGGVVGSVRVHGVRGKPLWSPDGSYIAVRGYDGVSVFGRNLSEVAEVTVEWGPEWVRWDPSGRYLWVASGKSVGKFRLDGAEVANITLTSGYVHRFSVSPDGNLIAVTTSNRFYVFSARGGSPLWIKKYDGVYGLPVWSRDGGKLLVVVPHGSGRGEVILCSSGGGEILRKFVDGGFVDGRVVDDLKSVLLVGWDGVVYLNYTDGSASWFMDRGLVGSLLVNYFPQGKAVLVSKDVLEGGESLGYVPRVTIYDLDGKELHEFSYEPANTAGVGLQLSRDGNLVLVTGLRTNYSVFHYQAVLMMYDVNGTKLWVRTFNVSSRDSLPYWLVGSDRIAVPITYVGRVTPTLSGTYVTTLYTVVLLNQYTGAEVARTKPSRYPIEKLIPGEGGYFAVTYSGYEGNLIEVYDGTGTLRTAIPERGHVSSLSLSGYGDVLAYGVARGDKHELVVRRLNGDIVGSVETGSAILRVSVSSKGLIAVAYGNGTLATYTTSLKLIAREDLSTGSLPSAYVSTMSWSPTGNYLTVYAAYFNHGEVRVYDAALRQVFWGYADCEPSMVAWVNGSTVLVAGEYGGELVRVGGDTPSLSIAAPSIGGHVIRNHVLAGKYLYVLLDDGAVAVIDVKAGEVLTLRVLDPAGVEGIAAYGDVLATYAYGGVVRLYRVDGATLKHALSLSGLGHVTGVGVGAGMVVVAGPTWVKAFGLDGGVKWSKELGGGAYVYWGPELDPVTGYSACLVMRGGVLEAVIYSPSGEEVLRYPLKDYFFLKWVSGGVLLLYDGGSTVSLVDVRSKVREEVPLRGLPISVFADESLGVAYVSLTEGLLRITASGEAGFKDGVKGVVVAGIGEGGDAYLVSTLNYGQLVRYSPSSDSVTGYQVLGARVLGVLVTESLNGNLLAVASDVRLVEPAKYGLLVLLPGDVAVNARIDGVEYSGVKGGLRLYVAEGMHEAAFTPAGGLGGVNELVGSSEWLANLIVSKEYGVRAGRVLIGKLPSTSDFLNSAGTVLLDASKVEAMRYSCTISWAGGSASRTVGPEQVLRVRALPGEYVVKCTPSLPSDLASTTLSPPPPEEVTVTVKAGGEAVVRLRSVNEVYGRLTVRNDAEAPVEYVISWAGSAPVSGRLSPGARATYYAPPGTYSVTVKYVEAPALDVGDAEAVIEAATITKEVSVKAGGKYVITPAKQAMPAHLTVKGAPGQEFTVSWGGGKETFRIPGDGVLRLAAAPNTEYVVEAGVPGLAERFTKRVDPIPPGGEAVVELPQPHTGTVTHSTKTTSVAPPRTTPAAAQPNYAPVVAVAVAVAAAIAVLAYRRRATRS